MNVCGRFVARRLLLAVLALGFLARLSAAPFPGVDAKWRHYQSPNFEVFSRNSDSESRELLHNLELVHAIFFETFGFKPTRHVPITVFFFSRDKHFAYYKPEIYRKLENTASVYSGGWDRGILTIAPLPTYEAAQHLAFGGYSHHLFRLMDANPPMWYSVGLSGILRNIELTSESIELGKAQPDQVRELQQATLIPVEVLLGADTQSNVYLSNRTNDVVHHEAWALVHYLYFGQHKIPRERISEFVNYALNHSRVFDAAATRQQFRASLGFDYPVMDEKLRGYLSSGRYAWSRLPRPKIPPGKSYAVRTVSLEEIQLRLAELAFRVNRAPEGKLALLQALNDTPAAARLYEALGADALKDNDPDGAIDRWARAREVGSSNPAVVHELVALESRRRFQRFDLYFRMPDETAEQLRGLLTASIAQEPDYALAYEMLAWVEATANDPKIKNINLVQQQFNRLQEKSRTLLALAVVRMRLNDKAGALQLLDSLAESEVSEWVEYGAEHTRAKLEDRPVDRANLPEAQPRMSTPKLRISPMRKVQSGG